MSWIDITRPISPQSPVYPGDMPPRVRSRTDASGVTMTRLEILTHTGTHLDLPGHVHPSAARPKERAILRAMIGRAYVIHLRARRRTQITIDELRGALPGRCPRRLLIRGAHSRGLSRAAARWLSGACILVGVDGLSIDPPAGRLEAHRILLGAGVLVLENLRLENVATGPYHLVSLPLRVLAGDGAPVRALLRRIEQPMMGGRG